MQHAHGPPGERIGALPLIDECRHAAGAEFDERLRKLGNQHRGERIPRGRSAKRREVHGIHALGAKRRACRVRQTHIDADTDDDEGRPAASPRRSMRMPPSFAPSCTMSFGHLSARPQSRDARAPAKRRHLQPATARRASPARRGSSSSPRGRAREPNGATQRRPRRPRPALWNSAGRRQNVPAAGHRGKQAIARRFERLVHLEHAEFLHGRRRQERADRGRVEGSIGDSSW